MDDTLIKIKFIFSLKTNSYFYQKSFKIKYFFLFDDALSGFYATP